MRTLTIGVLVASGGILAALPFRRYPAIGDASPAQATGPVESPLSTALAPNPPRIEPAVPGPLKVEAIPVSAHQPAPERPWPTQLAPPPRRRRPDVPLSLVDLAQPIDQPGVIDDRFNATRRVRKEELRRERQQLVMPDIDSLDSTQREQLQSAASPPRPAATGSLASSARYQSRIDPIPSSAATERDRNWIRQPQ